MYGCANVTVHVSISIALHTYFRKYTDIMTLRNGDDFEELVRDLEC